ncbi:MAG: hypothetical protein GXO86_14075 [Chlorobi bacterium]|nr:hypothetical protein [Chlorobiota bacterium]
MKSLRFLLGGILFTAFIFSGCNKAKEALDVTFNANYKTNLNVDVPAVARSVTFSESETIDPASDPEVSKYWDKIKKFEVQEITGSIISISKNVTLVSATLSVFNETKNAQWTFTNVPLAVGTTLTLDNSNGQWDTVAQILQDKKVFTVSVNGEVSEGDVSFTILVTIKTKVTANPL